MCFQLELEGCAERRIVRTTADRSAQRLNSLPPARRATEIDQWCVP
jgi:hypothetical protein